MLVRGPRCPEEDALHPMTMTTTTVTQQLRLGSPLSLSCSVPSCRSGTPTDTTLGSDSRARTGMYRWWLTGTLHHFGGKVYGCLCVRELLGLGPGIARARPRFTEIDQNPIENSTVFNPKNLPFKKTSRRFQDGEQPTTDDGTDSKKIFFSRTTFSCKDCKNSS